jgi:hypothetical protein
MNELNPAFCKMPARESVTNCLKHLKIPTIIALKTFKKINLVKISLF